MSIVWENLSYSDLAREDLASGLAAYIDQGVGVATIEYHEVGGAAQGLLATFELSDPSFTVASGVLTLRVSPAVKAVVAPGITAAEPDYYYLKNAEGNVVGEGSLTRTAAEQVDTGDILSFSSLQIIVALQSPVQVMGLSAWYSGQVIGQGTAGFQITDRSGNGNHGTQPTIADQPTAGGGLLTFDGTTDYFVTPLDFGGETQFAVVFRLNNTGGPTASDRLLSAGLLAPANEGTFRWSISSQIYQIDIPGTSQRTSTSALSNSATEHVLSVLYNNGAVTLRVNGVVVGSSTGVASFPVIGMDRLVVGGRNDTTGTTWQGTLRHMFTIQGRVPTTQELTFLENYI